MTPLDPRIVLDMVARLHHTTRWRLIGQERRAGLVAARSVAALALRLAGMSFPEIGAALGGRHHTTIMHEVRLAEADPERCWEVFQVAMALAAHTCQCGEPDCKQMAVR